MVEPEERIDQFLRLLSLYVSSISHKTLSHTVSPNDMNRRQFLSISAFSVSLSGCIEGDFDGTTENNSPTSKVTGTETPRNTDTETETPSPEGATPDCWPSMCEGTKLVEVVVGHAFSGEVVLQAECRGEAFSVQAGQSVQVAREEDAETCGISVSVDGEQVFRENVEDYESVTLTVSSNGEIDDEWAVI